MCLAPLIFSPMIKTSIIRLSDSSNIQKFESMNIAKVRLIKICYITQRRNEWVNWSGDTDVIGRHWGNVYFSVDEATAAVEEARSPGTQFGLEESAALLFISDDKGFLITDCYSQSPFSDFINKPLWLDCRNIYDIAKSIPQNNYRIKHLISNASGLAQDCIEDEQFYLRSSSAGGKRNGLAWSIKPREIDIKALISFTKKFNNALEKGRLSLNIPLAQTSNKVPPTKPGASLAVINRQAPNPEILLENNSGLAEIEINTGSSSEPVQPEINEPTQLITEREQSTKARVGQELFRSRLEAIEPCCRITGIAQREHLIASHIKPWRLSDNNEKLDGNNGLLLAPHIDHLFDGGYISFSDEGDLLISDNLDKAVLSAWSISPQLNIGRLNDSQKKYLQFHRQLIFRK